MFEEDEEDDMFRLLAFLLDEDLAGVLDLAIKEPLTLLSVWQQGWRGVDLQN